MKKLDIAAIIENLEDARYGLTGEELWELNNAIESLKDILYDET